MKKSFLLIFCIVTKSIIFAQSIFIKPKLLMNTGMFNYQKKRYDVKQPDFYPSKFGLEFTFGSSILYENKKGNQHNLNFDLSFLGGGYVLKNKLFQNPLLSSNLGFLHVRSLFNGVTPGIIGYSYTKNFNQKSLKIGFSVGVAYGINQSKRYYNLQIPTSETIGGSSSIDFVYVTRNFKYKQNGIFVTTGIKATLISKKGKPIFDIDVFFNKGLRQMMHHTIDYNYGYYSNRSLDVNVKNLPLRTRGTTLGAKLGFPIKLFTFKNKK